MLENPVGKEKIFLRKSRTLSLSNSEREVDWDVQIYTTKLCSFFLWYLKREDSEERKKPNVLPLCILNWMWLVLVFGCSMGIPTPLFPVSHTPEEELELAWVSHGNSIPLCQTHSPTFLVAKEGHDAHWEPLSCYNSSSESAFLLVILKITLDSLRNNLSWVQSLTWQP